MSAPDPIEAWALVPREEPRRFVLVDGRRSSWLFDVSPPLPLEWDGASLCAPRAEYVRADGWLFAVAGVELRLFYAHEDTRRALAALSDLACGLLFLRWLFDLHAKSKRHPDAPEWLCGAVHESGAWCDRPIDHAEVVKAHRALFFHGGRGHGTVLWEEP